MGKKGLGWSEAKHKDAELSAEWTHKTEEKYFLLVALKLSLHKVIVLSTSQ